MRKRRKSRNKRSKKNQKKIKVILVEGETEGNYVTYLKSLYHLNYTLKILKKSTLNENINGTISQLKSQHSVSDDELILLYDLENDEKEYDKFIRQDHLIHKNTYLTQPCIEYHFLLHHEKSNDATNKYRTAKDAEEELKEYLPQYKKGNSFIWNKSAVDIEEITLAQKRSIQTFKTYTDKSFSTVGHLIRDHFEK